MAVRLLAGIAARLIRRAVKRDRCSLVGNNRNNSRRFKISRRKFRMYKSVWS